MNINATLPPPTGEATVKEIKSFAELVKQFGLTEDLRERYERLLSRRVIGGLLVARSATRGLCFIPFGEAADNQTQDDALQVATLGRCQPLAVYVGTTPVGLCSCLRPQAR